MDIRLRSISFSHRPLHPFGISLIATAAVGALLFGVSRGTVESMFMLAAAFAVSAAHAAVSIADRGRGRSASQDVVRVGIPLFAMAGFAWMLGGSAGGADVRAFRDGAILLLTACIVLAVSSAAESPREWLTSFAMASAAATGWVLIVADRHDADAATWLVATIATVSGLSMVVFPVVQAAARNRALQSDIRLQRSTLWFMAGLCLVLLAASLLRDQDQWTVWYLPVLAISLLGLGMDRAPSDASNSAIAMARFLGSVPIWLTLVGSLLFAVAAIAWVLAAEDGPPRWGGLAVAAAVMVVFCTALAGIGLLRNGSMNRLADYASVLLHQSRVDSLTGLPNRRAISDRFSSELQRSARFNHPLTIGLIDIDDFKSVNDTWGHQTGDEVLQMVGRRLEQELRQIDVVGRYGGEEFLMLLPETAIEGAWIAADRVLRSIRTLEPHGQHGLRTVTVSIGLANFPQHGRTEADLFAAADEALYAAKRGGKNQVAVAER